MHLWQFIPSGVIVAAVTILARWVAKVQRRVQQQGERIAYLEAKADVERSDPP